MIIRLLKIQFTLKPSYFLCLAAERHEIGHNFNILKLATILRQPLLYHVAQASREYEQRHIASLQRIEKPHTALFEVCGRVAHNVHHVLTRDTRRDDQVKRLLPPVDHVGELLLARQMRIVLDGQVEVAEFFKLFFKTTTTNSIDKYAIEAIFLLKYKRCLLARR